MSSFVALLSIANRPLKLEVIFCVQAVISPVLANLFLHDAFDRWMATQYRQLPFERFADDAFVHCRTEQQAQEVRAAIAARLRDCGLELHPEKTRLIEFGRCAAQRRKKRGAGKPETFNFLGFTHICGTHHQTGNFTVHRRTIGKRMAAKLKDIRAQLRQRMHASPRTVGKWLVAVVRGHFQYHAIPGNWARLKAFRHDVLRLWFQAHRRRSQRCRLSWTRFREGLGRLLPPVQILQAYPDVRFDVKHPSIRGRNRVRW